MQKHVTLFAATYFHVSRLKTTEEQREQHQYTDKGKVLSYRCCVAICTHCTSHEASRVSKDFIYANFNNCNLAEANFDLHINGNEVVGSTLITCINDCIV